MQRVNRQLNFDPSLPLNAALNVSLLQTPLEPAQSNLHSLASVWAKRYVGSIASPIALPIATEPSTWNCYDSPVGRQETQDKLLKVLRLASAQAWAQTEVILRDEIYCHGIDPALIDPWAIAADSHQVFEKAIVAYGQGFSVQHISLVIGNDCGKLRQKYCQADPRLIGFVSMQFHYTGQTLLEQLEPVEHLLFDPYLKIMDDHLYMPLRDAYLAAAKHGVDSETLRAVQRLLAVSTKIARNVTKQVRSRRPGYQSYSGSLNQSAIRASSIRDVEMFQVYLCLCLLEGNIRSIQEQLFPLCVMLYPRLNVSWELVQEMLEMIGWEMHKRMMPGDMIQFLPYLRTLGHMFSREVFESATTID